MSENIEQAVEPVVEAVEEKVVEESFQTESIDPSKSFHDKDEEPAEPADPADGDPDEGDPDDKKPTENKPWQNKERGYTPKWARDRFKEQTTTIRELKQQNADMIAAMKELNGSQDTESYTREDFPDDEAYINYMTDLKVQEKLDVYEQQRTETEKTQAELAEADQREQMYVDKAKATHLTDYDEVMGEMAEEIAANPVMEVQLPSDLVSKINSAEIGPYIKYGIATNAEGIRDQLLAVPVNQRTALINKLGNDYAASLSEEAKIERQGQPAAPPAPAQAAAPVAPVEPAALPQKTPPKAPPKQKAKKTVDINSLSGDDYVRARNKQLNKR